jgi:hypothetical protein
MMGRGEAPAAVVQAKQEAGRFLPIALNTGHPAGPPPPLTTIPPGNPPASDPPAAHQPPASCPPAARQLVTHLQHRGPHGPQLMPPSMLEHPHRQLQPLLTQPPVRAAAAAAAARSGGGRGRGHAFAGR